jgi:DNA-binding response OmpR family regulator
MARVLVAEDETKQADLVRINLEDEGHEVVVTEDGRYALKALMEENFDVVVLDLMMPFTDGFEVLGNLGRKKAKVIVITGRDDSYTLGRVENLGVGGFFVKPYDPMKLVEKVKELAGPA